MAGLYVHIPFCEHKCVYCDFYSIAPDRKGRHALAGPMDGFLSGLGAEIDLKHDPSRRSQAYESLFLGGGTPSLLSQRSLQFIMDRLQRRYALASDAEITLETNPGTVDPGKLAGFRELGVNRLSIGIQSFHDDDLSFLTRIHSAEEARRCVRSAFEAGFENVSVDLIFSLPGQSVDRWRSDLETAIALGPTHISCYSLIVEPNTPLYRLVHGGQVRMPDADRDAELYDCTMELMAANGYQQYEVSNFARPGFRSRHNSNYWHHGEYVGFGPSAHSFENGRRSWNVADLATYVERTSKGFLPIAGEEVLTTQQMQEEEIFLGLRGEGLDVAGFNRRHTRDLLAEHHQAFDTLLNRDLAQFDGRTLRLTRRGYMVCDEITTWFR